MIEKKVTDWVPKTELGRKVMNGEIKDIKEIYEKGLVIREPEIVDCLIPDLENVLMLTGGMPGKGGGIRRTGIRITTRMHKSGRRRTLRALVVVGNKNGIIGIGFTKGKDASTAVRKATKQAKLNIIQIRRGCGSWECECKSPHSIPFKTRAKVGSVKVELMPAPKGIGLCVADEIKKLMRLTGIKDIWIKSRGNTRTRVNFVKAVFNALSNLNKIKVDEETIKTTGMVEGAI